MDGSQSSGDETSQMLIREQESRKQLEYELASMTERLNQQLNEERIRCDNLWNHLQRSYDEVKFITTGGPRIIRSRGWFFEDAFGERWS
jgi:hypothetical protein